MPLLKLSIQRVIARDTRDVVGEAISIYWMDLDPAPKALLQLICSNYKKGNCVGGRCSSKKIVLPCSYVCGCTNMQSIYATETDSCDDKDWTLFEHYTQSSCCATEPSLRYCTCPGTCKYIIISCHTRRTAMSLLCHWPDRQLQILCAERQQHGIKYDNLLFLCFKFLG